MNSAMLKNNRIMGNANGVAQPVSWSLKSHHHLGGGMASSSHVMGGRALVRKLMLLLGIVIVVFCWVELNNGTLTSPGLAETGQQQFHRKDLLAQDQGTSKLVKPIESNRKFPAQHLTKLVLVACHSVYTGLDFAHPEDKSSWLLLDYQKEVPGQTESFLSHIKMGVMEASKDESALLLFSGGQTRKDAGPRAEAMGYWMVAEARDWFGYKESVRSRTFTEEHSRDSFENFLFGLCRFYELTGHYPEHIVIVSYEFKKQRFTELHARALRWPSKHLDFVGTPALNTAAIHGEEDTRKAFETDPYGCQNQLAAKRLARDPFAHGGYSPDRCPDLAELLRYCSRSAYQGALPWARTLR